MKKGCMEGLPQNSGQPTAVVGNLLMQLKSTGSLKKLIPPQGGRAACQQRRARILMTES